MGLPLGAAMWTMSFHSSQSPHSSQGNVCIGTSSRLDVLINDELAVETLGAAANRLRGRVVEDVALVRGDGSNRLIECQRIMHP
jgi:hypothetical protein